MNRHLRHSIDKGNAVAMHAIGTAPRPGLLAAKAGASTVVQEYLAFHIGPQEYGIDLPLVREIRRCVDPMPVDGAPLFVKGIFNLRGAAVPVVDMQAKLGCKRIKNALAMTIIVQVAERSVGLMVDAVWDVVQLSADQVRPMRDFSAMANATRDGHCISGLGTFGERRLFLLDIEHLLTSREFGLPRLPRWMQ